MATANLPIIPFPEQILKMQTLDKITQNLHASLAKKIATLRNSVSQEVRLHIILFFVRVNSYNTQCTSDDGRESMYLGQLSSVSTRLSQLLSLPLLTRLDSEMSSPPSAPTYCFNSDGVVVSDADLLSASDMSSASSRLNDTLSPTLSALLSAISLLADNCKTLPDSY